MDNVNQTVGDIVRSNSQAALVFETHGIDYCCGGKVSLSVACEQRGLDPNVILEEISTLPSSGSPDVTNWSLEFLIDYIINTHHHYVRTMVGPISDHAAKVAYRHGEAHPETIEVEKLFKEIRLELESHMVKEEQILFPYIKRLAATEQADRKSSGGGFGSVRGPISVMEAEHESVARLYEQIHAITNGLEIPPDACTTFTLLYKELREFERDLHMHIHLENNVLHPRAIALEDALTADS